MTEAQFIRAYGKARKSFSKLTRATVKKIHDIYEEAAGKVARIVQDATERELSVLTSASWSRIKAELESAASDIRSELRAQLSLSVEEGADIIAGINEKYLIDVMEYAGGKITKSGIVSMFAGVSRSMVESMVNRVYTDGYAFSERIWNISNGFQNSIKRVISVGTAMGRDAIDIARDIEVYVSEGREALAKRYGDLVKDEPGWRTRIGRDVDYNALRLVRSEMYMAIQDSAVSAGRMTPSVTGYNWVRNTSEDWNCDCPDLEAGSPYQEDEIPDYPHPSCLCQIVAVLMERQDFVDDLVSWANGEDVDYLDTWKAQYYDQ